MTKVERHIAHLLARAKIHRIQPGDIIIIGNIGPGTAATQGITEALATIRDTAGASHVYAFEHDIDLKVISERERRIRGSDIQRLLGGSR